MTILIELAITLLVVCALAVGVFYALERRAAAKRSNGTSSTPRC